MNHSRSAEAEELRAVVAGRVTDLIAVVGDAGGIHGLAWIRVRLHGRQIRKPGGNLS